MKYVDCFRFLASRRNGQVVITSAGHSSNVWWTVTRDSEATFYLAASMSLSTMFASGLAFGQPETKFWAFMGDGAFCMNPGMLMVERMMDLPNLTHFLVSNRRYGATGNAALPNQDTNDYAAIARGMGLTRIFNFDSIASLESGFDSAVTHNAPGHTFVILEVEPLTPEDRKTLRHAELDGPEQKFRFGRHIEKLGGRPVFDYRLDE
jgi:sulfopyruvate decarboxylase subunit beta